MICAVVQAVRFEMQLIGSEKYTYNRRPHLTQIEMYI